MKSVYIYVQLETCKLVNVFTDVHEQFEHILQLDTLNTVNLSEYWLEYQYTHEISKICIIQYQASWQVVTNYYKSVVKPVQYGQFGTNRSVLILQVSLHTSGKCVDYVGFLIFKCPH